MASLLSGPRLGCPSPTGFSVWARCDASALVELQVRVTGATDWTSQGSATTDATLYETVVLYATGLQHTTKYDYRLLVDGVEAASYWTVTMPPDGGGRFIAYQLCDTHTGYGYPSGTVAPTNALRYLWTYHAANHSGTPAVALVYGDFVTGITVPSHGATWSEACVNRYHGDIFDPALTGGAIEFFHYIPLLFMWDDWDFAGNNSNRTIRAVAATDAEITKMMDALWRDQPRHAPPSFGYTVAIAGVPFIVADARSQKASNYVLTGTSPPSIQILFNNEPYDYSNTIWGLAQDEWLKTQLGAYANRALVVFIGTHSLLDFNISPTTPGALAQRDSGGFYHASARNYVFDAARVAGYGWRRNLIVWSGDDHYNAVFDADFCTPVHSLLAAPHLGTPIGVPHSDFKVMTGEASDFGFVYMALHATRFVYRDSGTDGKPCCFVRWDINSANGGEHVRARATYIVAALQASSAPPFGQPYTPGDTLMEPRDIYSGDPKYPGRRATGDFWFQDGHLSYYVAGVSGMQQHPADNGPGPREFRETYADEILGTYRKRDSMVRNTVGELRELRDVEDMDRDDILGDYRIRGEGADDEGP